MNEPKSFGTGIVWCGGSGWNWVTLNIEQYYMHKGWSLLNKIVQNVGFIFFTFPKQTPILNPYNHIGRQDNDSLIVYQLPWRQGSMTGT